MCDRNHWWFCDKLWRLAYVFTKCGFCRDLFSLRETIWGFIDQLGICMYNFERIFEYKPMWFIWETCVYSICFVLLCCLIIYNYLLEEVKQRMWHWDRIKLNFELIFMSVGYYIVICVFVWNSPNVSDLPTSIVMVKILTLSRKKSLRR